MPRPEASPATAEPDTLSPPIRCQLRGKVDEATERFALRTVLAVARLFGLAAGTHLRQLRNLDDPLASMQARLEEAQLNARLAWEIVDLLSARLRKISEKRRPHYSPSQRFRALESLLGWSCELAARAFLVCSSTISNWERSVDPHARAVGSTVRAVPPVRRLADTVRATVDLLARSGFGGQEVALAHYVAFRPHQGLQGATPAEAFLSAQPRCAAAQSPPRALVGEGPGDSPFAVAYLDPRNRRFPVLLKAT